MPEWFDDCGQDAGLASTTVSQDGLIAVTLEDTSPAPGTFADTPVCHLLVTNLATGQSRELPGDSGRIMRTVQGVGWSISPNGRYIAIQGKSAVYIQDLQAGTPPRAVSTGFAVSGVGWYPDSSTLLVDGPSLPGGGRGPIGTENRLFKITLSGDKLGRWLIKPYPAYLVTTPFIQIGPAGQVYAGVQQFYDPKFGGKPNMPAGYYALTLRRQPKARLIARAPGGGYLEPVASFGLDTSSGLIFVAGGFRKICSATIVGDTRHCVTFPGSSEVISLSGVQVVLTPPS